jgi:hypothetical protein
MYSLHFLVRSSKSKMLSWPNSLVMLQFVDPNALIGDEVMVENLLYYLANMVNPFDYSIHENQPIPAKQLIECDANVNAVSMPHGELPLHNTCFWSSVTNLDFNELLLKAGTDPNIKDHLGRTPIMSSTPDAPGAAKFLLNWPTTDTNIPTRSGASFLGRVRSTITDSFIHFLITPSTSNTNSRCLGQDTAVIGRASLEQIVLLDP